MVPHECRGKGVLVCALLQRFVGEGGVPIKVEADRVCGIAGRSVIDVAEGQLWQNIAQGFDFARGLIRGAVRTVQPGVICFLRPLCLSPSEVRDNFGPVRDGFECPKPDCTVDGCRVPVGPVHRARLLFHHPQPPGPGHVAVQIVMHGDNIRVANPHVTVDQGITTQGHPLAELFQKTERVGIPACKVQICAHVPMVKTHFGHHEVVGDEHIFPAARTKDIALLPIELRRHVAEEPTEIQPMRRCSIGSEAVGQIDLVKAAIGH